MKYILISAIVLSLIACSAQDGLEMETKSTIEISNTDTEESIIAKAAHVVPSPNQYEALKNEFIAFIHFGPNTFTRMEWGNGKEDPAIFKLENLDTDQWCRSMKAAGMKMVVFTAKHHDGFCLWQSRYTTHGVMSSPFRNGRGDVMRDLAESCQKYGLKLGVYLSPADLYQIENSEGLYGNLSKYSERVIPRVVEGRPFENTTSFTFEVDDYNEYMLNQLFELLTEYGPIHEVWFDGAHPKRKGGQKYNYAAWKELIQSLAPEAVIFGRQDMRWCGNESGGTRDSEWNIIPYQEDPNAMNSFADITGDPIAQRAQLYQANYLHYQPAETNTSIREGWFYRDEHDQKVRNADDVFDIYERSVGGNSIFLLNIPPNREGKFSDEDVQVLEETGKRIKDTYGTNLFQKAKGPKEILDNNDSSYLLLTAKEQSFEIRTDEAVTINRFVVQEAISTHGERIEKFAVDAWLNNEWTEIALSTNVGYKRILRFPEVNSKRYRIRILAYRALPAIATVSAHYYQSRPPQLYVNRNVIGMVDIGIKQHTFRWKPHGEKSSENLNSTMVIRYTKDGSEPESVSKQYTDPFFFAQGEIKARAFMNDQKGSIASEQFGIIKDGWALIKHSGEKKKHEAELAIDGDNASYWHSKQNNRNRHFLEIDLGESFKIKGFIYTPQTENASGMIQKGQILFSNNGKDWKVHEEFTFGNLINDPTSRKHNFANSIQTRYVKILALEIADNGTTASAAEIDFIPGGNQ